MAQPVPHFRESALPVSVRVVLADDHELVRTGIGALLGAVEGVEVVAEAQDGEELLKLVDGLLPDIVISDLAMPGIDGYAAIAEIHVRHPQVKIIALSMHDSAEAVKRAVHSGACGYLRKDAQPFELAHAIRSVATKGNYFSPSIAQALLAPVEPSAEEELTSRQVEILRMLARGMASKQIAFELGLSSKTVDVHRARIMARLGLTNLSSLTRYALRKGLIAT